MTDRGRRADRGIDRLGDVLSGYLEKWGVAKELESLSAVDRWATVVGPGIAEVTRARSVSRGTLFVEVRTHAWMSELDLMRHELLKRLNADGGGVRIERIVFTLPEGGTWLPEP
jgi:predicted nucleic acid-binding Zn ribbon protein